jgi:hypothetical protein
LELTQNHRTTEPQNRRTAELIQTHIRLCISPHHLPPVVNGAGNSHHSSSIMPSLFIQNAPPLFATGLLSHHHITNANLCPSKSPTLQPPNPPKRQKRQKNNSPSPFPPRSLPVPSPFPPRSLPVPSPFHTHLHQRIEPRPGRLGVPPSLFLGKVLPLAIVAKRRHLGAHERRQQSKVAHLSSRSCRGFCWSEKPSAPAAGISISTNGTLQQTDKVRLFWDEMMIGVRWGVFFDTVVIERHKKNPYRKSEKCILLSFPQYL